MSRDEIWKGWKDAYEAFPNGPAPKSEDDKEEKEPTLVEKILAAHGPLHPTTIDMKGAPLTPELVEEMRKLLTPPPFLRPIQLPSLESLGITPDPPFEPGQITSFQRGPFQLSGIPVVTPRNPEEGYVADHYVLDEAAHMAQLDQAVLARYSHPFLPQQIRPGFVVIIENMPRRKRRKSGRGSTMRLKQYTRLLRKRANRERRQQQRK